MQVRKSTWGEYAVVYRRELGAQTPGVTFVPDMSRIIRVTTRVPHEEENDPDSALRYWLDEQGFIGAAEFIWDGHKCKMLVQPVRSKQRTLDTHTCVVRVGPREKALERSHFIGYPNCPGHDFEQDKLTDLLKDGKRSKGSTMSFGVKLTESIKNSRRKKFDHFGFNFLQLELATCNSGSEGRELLIAVKLPKDGDVPAQMILKQRIENSGDLSIINRQDSSLGFATLHNHCLGAFNDRSSHLGWEPSVGLFFKGDASFDAGKLEQFLLTKEKPYHMYHLSKVAEWFSNMIAAADLSAEWDAAFVEGLTYVMNRANTMGWEASFQDEFELSHTIQSSV